MQATQVTIGDAAVWRLVGMAAVALLLLTILVGQLTVPGGLLGPATGAGNARVAETARLRPSASADHAFTLQHKVAPVRAAIEPVVQTVQDAAGDPVTVATLAGVAGVVDLAGSAAD